MKKNNIQFKYNIHEMKHKIIFLYRETMTEIVVIFELGK
jgi:hypothetical protein